MRTCEHVNMRTCEHVNMRTFEHANMPTCKHVNILVILIFFSLLPVGHACCCFLCVLFLFFAFCSLMLCLGVQPKTRKDLCVVRTVLRSEMSPLKGKGEGSNLNDVAFNPFSLNDVASIYNYNFCAADHNNNNRNPWASFAIACLLFVLVAFSVFFFFFFAFFSVSVVFVRSFIMTLCCVICIYRHPNAIVFYRFL